MTLPDDASPKSSSVRPSRSHNAAKNTPQQFSETALSQRLQDASSYLQEQTEKLSHTISEYWPEGQTERPAPTVNDGGSSAEPSEKTQATKAEKTEKLPAATAAAHLPNIAALTAIAPPHKPETIATLPNAPGSDAKNSENSDDQDLKKISAEKMQYGQKDTLNHSAGLHPRFIWPD